METKEEKTFEATDNPLIRAKKVFTLWQNKEASMLEVIRAQKTALTWQESIIQNQKGYIHGN